MTEIDGLSQHLVHESRVNRVEIATARRRGAAKRGYTRDSWRSQIVITAANVWQIGPFWEGNWPLGRPLRVLASRLRRRRPETGPRTALGGAATGEVPPLRQDCVIARGSLTVT